MRAESYRAGIRAATRGLWTGALDWFQCYDALYTTITYGLASAFHQGMKQYGITPDDYTEEEKDTLREFIISQVGYIAGFVDAVERGSKANGGKLGTLMRRAELWANRWHEINQIAIAFAVRNGKLKWVVDFSKENCASCLKLNGKVKRATYWLTNGILPRVAGAPYLDCKGYKCGCELVPTDEPCSKGPLPGLP